MLQQSMNRDMVRRKDVNLNKKEVNTSAVEYVEKSRNMVGDLLIGYKQEMHKSIGLRRAIINELDVYEKKDTRKKLEKVAICSYLQHMEKWEINARE